jgi:hypothetical protein
MSSHSPKSSYEQINYSLRPAKAIERKMLCEAMRRLSVFAHLDTYRYVGFGSPYFSDFTLIHKSLGINKLISIERDAHNSERFYFNQPYSCIDIHFDESTNVLPKLDWKGLTILWLDYDKPLHSPMFQDIASFFSKANAGSMFIISINVQPDRLPPSENQDNLKDLKQHRINCLVNRVGRNKLPIDIDKYNLAGEKYRNVIGQIVIDQIYEELKIRNGAIGDKSQKLLFRQTFNFAYSDNAQMLTIGGILYEESQHGLIESMKLNQLNFISDNSNCFEISVPNLTFKEIRSLDSNLPDNINVKLGKLKTRVKPKSKMPKLSREDIINYSKIYRYFPTFAESNV